MSVIFFPELLRSARNRKHLNMEQASELLDVPLSSYAGRERGERMPWTESDIQHRICSEFDIDMDELQRSIRHFKELKNMHKEFDYVLMHNYDLGRVMIEQNINAMQVLRKALDTVTR